MPSAKIMTWNIEHMHDWFNDTEPRVVNGFGGVARKVAAVIGQVDPDVLCIQEGPTRLNQMENFFADCVPGDWTVVRGETGGSQKPYIVYRNFQGLNRVDEIDFDADAWKYQFLDYREQTRAFRQQTKAFARLPVELVFHTSAGAFSLLCLHLKSTISERISDVVSSDPQRRTHAIVTALEQRARILQEAKLLREYIQGHPFADDVENRILVAGDLNDGPGRDMFEERYFGTDVLRRIRGDIDHPNRVMHDLLDSLPSSRRFTAIFYDRIDGEVRQLFLDHFLALPEFLTGSPRVDAGTATVEHTAYMGENEGDWSRRTKPNRHLYPSDHRPCSVVVRF